LHAAAAVLYSEDMQDGLVVEKRMRIINAFTQLPSTGA
jgi:predicted nucleic acid-binding protein